MNFTSEQLRAIEARHTNILLSASAGTGKTKTLVERVLRLIDEGTDIDRMLIVTFTRAAAAEMKSRILARLTERATAGDKRVPEQMLRLERASICTLHSFCADLLRTNFESAGVDPAFTVLDDSVDQQLLDDALDEALEHAYANIDDISELDYGRGPKGVRVLLELLIKAMLERPDTEEWLDKSVACNQEMISAWTNEMIINAKTQIDMAIDDYEQALMMPDCPLSYVKAMNTDLAVLRDIKALDEYDPICRALGEFKQCGARASTKGETISPENMEIVKDLRKEAKKKIDGVAITKYSLADCLSDMPMYRTVLNELAVVAKDAVEIYERLKDEQGGLTYNDLERRALDALKNAETAKAVREKYDYIFVDEYQDTSEIQEAIVSRICRTDNVFMVGDVKQSVYRFRGAEAGLFNDKRDKYANGLGGTLMPLTTNFRSTKNVLRFVNMVFEHTMTGGCSEIVYDETARLNPPESAEEGEKIEIHLLDAAEQEDVEDEIAEMKAAEREGLFIAQTIRSMMDKDKSLRYSDFAILTRAKSSAFTPIIPMLLSQSIPAYAQGAAGYFDTVEIALATTMLRLLANRRNDAALIGLMHSPLFGVTAQELAQIRLYSDKKDYPEFYDAALRYTENDDAISRKLKRLFELLDEWQMLMGVVSLGMLTRQIIDESGLYTYAGALPGGDRREANLDRLINEAQTFDDSVSGSVTRFLEALRRKTLKGDEESAQVVGENDNVVMLMTVHKSKGLERRIVFGALMNRQFRLGNTDALVADGTLGIGCTLCDAELRTKRKTLAQAAIRENQKRKDKAEELRILYVLLTRAQKKLILTATVKNIESQEQKWQTLAKNPWGAGCPIDWVMGARTAAEQAGEETYSDVYVHALSELAVHGADAAELPYKTLLEIEHEPKKYINIEADRAINWLYPDTLSGMKPMKLTVSGLIREVQGPLSVVDMAERPAFMAEDGARHMTGAERGTAYHRALQLIDLNNCESAAAIRAQLDGFVRIKRMTEVERDAVDVNKIYRFLSGELGTRMKSGQNLHREWSFNLRMRAKEALTEEEAGRFGDEELLVQGTVDCCFTENGAWVLLDYKTDRARDYEGIRERYIKQLKLYALALEKITGMPVKEKRLCLIGEGKTIVI